MLWVFAMNGNVELHFQSLGVYEADAVGTFIGNAQPLTIGGAVHRFRRFA